MSDRMLVAAIIGSVCGGALTVVLFRVPLHIAFRSIGVVTTCLVLASMAAAWIMGGAK